MPPLPPVSSPEARLEELGISLPLPAKAVASYAPWVEDNGLIYISGQLPFEAGKIETTGRLGAELSLEHGQNQARLCTINLLAQLREAAGGTLDAVGRVIRLGGFIACSDDFTQQPQVLNAASTLMIDIFGETKGLHARAAVGVTSLPLGAAVEIEGLFRLA